MAPRRLPLALVDRDDAPPEDLRREAPHVEGQPDSRREPGRQLEPASRHDGVQQNRQREEEPDDLHQHRGAAEGLDVDVDRSAQPPAVEEETRAADDADEQPSGDGGGGVRDGDEESLQPPPFVARENHVEVPGVAHGSSPSVAGGSGGRQFVRCASSSAPGVLSFVQCRIVPFRYPQVGRVGGVPDRPGGACIQAAVGATGRSPLPDIGRVTRH